MKNINKILWLFLAMGVLVVLAPFPSEAQGKRDIILRWAPGNYRDVIKPGKDNISYLEVQNSGTEVLTGIKLSVVPPEGWSIGINPGDIASLAPDRFQTVDINIRPASNVSRGEYKITFVAEAQELRKVVSIWVRVETTATTWLWIGVIIGAVVITGFVFVFLRFGRQ